MNSIGLESGMTVVGVVITPPETFARHQVIGRVRRKAARAHSGAAVIWALGSDRAQRDTLSCSVCLFEWSGRRARNELHTADPRAQITAESKRSVDRHSMSPGRLAPDATRDTYRMKRSAMHERSVQGQHLVAAHRGSLQSIPRGHF